MLKPSLEQQVVRGLTTTEHSRRVGGGREGGKVTKRLGRAVVVDAHTYISNLELAWDALIQSRGCEALL